MIWSCLTESKNALIDPKTKIDSTKLEVINDVTTTFVACVYSSALFKLLSDSICGSLIGFSLSCGSIKFP